MAYTTKTNSAKERGNIDRAGRLYIEERRAAKKKPSNAITLTNNKKLELNEEKHRASLPKTPAPKVSVTENNRLRTNEKRQEQSVNPASNRDPYNSKATDAKLQRLMELSVLMQNPDDPAKAPEYEREYNELMTALSTDPNTNNGAAINTASGAGKTYASGFVNLAGDIAQLGGASEREERMTQLQAEIDGYAAQGNGEMVAKLEKELKYLIDNPGTDNDVRKGEYYAAADKLRASGERDIAAAKGGQGRFGRALIDAEVAALQLGADTALGAFTGGGSLIPSVIRSIGEGSQLARQSGASYGAALAAGAGNGLVSYATDLIGQDIKAFRASKSESVTPKIAAAAKKAVEKWGQSDKAEAVIGTIGKEMGSFVNRGAEYFISAMAAPLVRAIYDNSSLKDYGSLDFYKNGLYEGVVGGIVGLISQGASDIKNKYLGGRFAPKTNNSETTAENNRSENKLDNKF